MLGLRQMAGTVMFGLAISIIPIVAHAQTDVFSVNYFDNIYTLEPTPTSTDGVSDSTVRITNPGENGAPSLADPTGGDLCAMIYVFRPDQQMAACCGCKVTPNGLRTISVREDLADNPLTAEEFPRGVIKIVSSTGTLVSGSKGKSYLKCDATDPVPTPSLIAWGTHVQHSGRLTETAFERAPLSADELALLRDRCTDIKENGSGFGKCSCGFEDDKDSR